MVFEACYVRRALQAGVPPLQVRLVELYCETTLEGLDDVKFEDVAW